MNLEQRIARSCRDNIGFSRLDLRRQCRRLNRGFVGCLACRFGFCREAFGARFGTLAFAGGSGQFRLRFIRLKQLHIALRPALRDSEQQGCCCGSRKTKKGKRCAHERYPAR